MIPLTTSPNSIHSLISGSHALHRATAMEKLKLAVTLEEDPVERFRLVELSINIECCIVLEIEKERWQIYHGKLSCRLLRKAVKIW